MTTRKTEYKTINPLDVTPYFANPPKRTDREANDFKNLVEYVAQGGTVPAVSVVRDPITGKFLQVGGHRRVLAHIINGRLEIPAEITTPNAGEDPAQVQQELWASEHKGRAIVGKDYFFVAMATNGAVLMNKTVERAFELVQEHVSAKDNTLRDWLKRYGTSDLMKTTLKVTNFVNNIRTSKKKAMKESEYSEFFRLTMAYLVRHNIQREIRDYVTHAETNTKKAASLEEYIRTDKPFKV